MEDWDFLSIFASLSEESLTKNETLMDIETFKEVINDILVPYGYKKQRTNSWIRKGDEISMKVYLQKSSFSCRYYFHCYYVINNMPKELKGKMRLGLI